METNNMMRSEIKFGTSSRKFIGPALTVKLYPRDLVDRSDALKVVGAVVDGAIRDRNKTRLTGFAVASGAVVPRSTHSPYSKRMEPVEINVPIHCGGVLVKLGDNPGQNSGGAFGRIR
jgi:regulator of RNase E activity RraA